jgi:hypothetical protein
MQKLLQCFIVLIFVFVDRILVRVKSTTGPNCLKNYVDDRCCGLLRCTQPSMLLFMYTGSRTYAAIICIVIRSYCLYEKTEKIWSIKWPFGMLRVVPFKVMASGREHFYS